MALVLRARVIRECGAQGDDVIGEDTSLGIAHDRSDRLRLPGDLGLASQRLELPADLAGEVAQAGEVGLHRIELAEGLLLASAVLQDSRRFLDEPAAIFRRRLEHRVETALADDHVHLAAQAGVAQKLLHIEETASLAVDRVLTGTVAEERTADRHLGVLDRQRAVGVVDRELHLGATERTARRCTGEDHVFHLAAAQGLRTLLAHHPGEGVDDVRLAGTVRADDAGDAGFEHEARRLSERLEPLERQALQMHGGTVRPGRITRLRYRNSGPAASSRAGGERTRKPCDTPSGGTGA